MQALRTRVGVLLGEYNHSARQARDEKANLVKAKQHLKHVEASRDILQSAAQQVQEVAHKRLSDVVSRCLSAVFDEPYRLVIHFDRKRGKTEARLTFERDGNEVDPTTAAGGSVVAVAAFALRLACLVLTRPEPRRLLVLDEPFFGLDKERVPKVRDLLMTIAKEMKVQFILVTHNEELACGKIVKIGRKK